MDRSIGLAPAELQQRALRGVGWSSLGTVALLPLNVAVAAVVARTLGIEGFARFALLAFVVPLIYSASDLGFSQALTRSASRAFAAGDLAATRGLLRKALGWNVLRLPFLVAVTLLVARPTAVGAVLVAGYLVATQAASGLNFALNAENRGATLAKIALVTGIGSAGATMGTAAAGAAPSTVWAASLASGAIAVPLWLAAANRSLLRAALVPSLPRSLPGGFWRFALGSVTVSLLSLLVFSRSEILVIEALGDERTLAVFALAFGLAQRLTAPADTLLGPLTPALSALDGAHPDRLRAAFARSLRLSVAAVALLAGGTLVGTAFAAPVLFGSEYSGVGPAFAALAVVALCRSAAQPYTALAYAVGRPGVVLRSLAIALVVDVAVAVALVPVLGLWGAVAANAAGGLVAVWLTARATDGPRSLARAGVPVRSLALVAATAVAASLAAALAADPFGHAPAAVAAFAAGAGATALLVRRRGGLLDGTDAAAVAQGLAGRLGPVGRAATALVRAAT